METTIDLSEVCFEHIKDTFYYGLFGDFKLVVDKSTGYFNATKLCVAGGKEFIAWKRIEKSKRIIKYYESRYEDLHGGFVYEVKGDNKDITDRQITGTYVPKELILDIASWVSIEFYDRCNNIIINYFVKEFKKMDNRSLKKKVKEVEKQMEKLTLENTKKEETIHQQKDKIDQLIDSTQRLEESNKKLEDYVRSLGISLEEVKDQNEELLDETKGLKKQNKKIQRKLGIAVIDRAPQPENESKRERFVLIKRNDPDYLTYYVIRAQHDYTTRKLKTERRHFPKLKVLLDLKCNPNSKTYYIRTKETLKEKGVAFKHNNIDLEDSKLTEKELIEELKVINDEKLVV